jgi:hypothetical protein
MKFTWRGLTVMARLSARDYSDPPRDGEVSAEILATVHQSPQTKLTFAGEVPYHPRDSVHVLTAHMKNESDD